MRPETDELCGVEAVHREWIDSLIRKLQQRIHLQAVYLFGSRATNEHLTWSDYDICVISEDFTGMRPWERMELVLSCWEGRRALEPVCFTPEEFERSGYSLVVEIRDKGKLLYP